MLNGVKFYQPDHHHNPDNILVQCVCPMCNDAKVLTVTKEQWDQYHAGAMIQDAFSRLDKDDRERLITGICPTCWDKAFGD